MTDDDFPTELPADPDGGAGALRWTSGVIVLAACALAAFNAGAIETWTLELAPGPGTARVMSAADAWKATTARLGLDAAHSGIHHAWTHAEAARFPGECAHEAAGETECAGQPAKSDG